VPDGACVIRYAGARGVVWRIKFRDADGHQHTETLGRADDGWTKRKAEQELRARLTDVDRHGLRRPRAVTFSSFADGWLGPYAERKALKWSTRRGYQAIIDRYLVPAFGRRKLDSIDVADVERFTARLARAGLGPRTIMRQLNVLGLLFKAAEKQGLVHRNPVRLVERPREPRRRWTILTPVQVAAVEQAFRELIDEADERDRRYLEVHRTTFLVVWTLGLRRGEALGLRWRDVALADPNGPRLRVRETLVRGRVDTPKSARSERTLALCPRIASELFEHRARSAYSGDDERVFCQPFSGAPLEHKRYADNLRAAMARAGLGELKVRPFHDGRHTSITNAAAAGLSPAALMARSGHSDFSTTQLYIDLAGELFRAEAEQAELHVLGAYQSKKPVESEREVA
jgi:integrase